MYKLLFVLLLAVSLVSSTTLNYLLYSVSTSATSNDKQLMIINPWDYKVVYNNTINTRYDIIDILSLDTTTNTLIVLASDASYQILAVIDTTSKDLIQLSEVVTGYDFNYAVQPYLFMEGQKTATIPAQVKVNGTYYNSLMETDFATQNVNIYNLTLTNGAPYLIQGFDYISGTDYIGFLNYNLSIHLMAFDYLSPETTTKVYYSIQNLVLVAMIFTDPSSNIYFINQQYINASTPSGYYDICAVSLSEQPGQSTCNSIYTFYLGNIESYTFEPMILSEDKTTLLIIANQIPSSGTDITPNFYLTYVQLNTNFKQIINVTIPNDDPFNDIFYSRNFKL